MKCISHKSMMGQELLDYLIGFLLGSDLRSERAEVYRDTSLDLQRRLIRYTSNLDQVYDEPIIIYSSEFFNRDVYGTSASEPKLPLAEWEGIPILFGLPRHELINSGHTLVIYADLIASSFYLMSRYEEIYRRVERDEHGRFLGKWSLPVRAGFIHRPIIDEYGRVLRRLIRESGIAERMQIDLTEPLSFFSHINLTHDIDQPYLYRGVKGFLRSLRDGQPPWKMLSQCFGSPLQDPYFTFPKLFEWNKQLKAHTPQGITDVILFVKPLGKHLLDRPVYRLNSKYMRMVLALGQRIRAKIGLHCSYSAGLDPSLLAQERKQIQNVCTGQSVSSSRHHFLSQREPEDMLDLLDAGIRHDYTMGYADVAGFRLGTCRPVRFINPNTRQLSELIMHPLTMMDVSLSRSDFMGLEQEEAEQYASELIRLTADYGGELNMLWHNEQFVPEVHPWHAVLYRSLLRLIQSIEENDPRWENVDDDEDFCQVLQKHGCIEVKPDEPTL